MVKINFPSRVQQNLSTSEEKFGAEVTEKANKQFYGFFLTTKLHRITPEQTSCGEQYANFKCRRHPNP